MPTPLTINQMLGYTQLTGYITKVAGGIPKVLPDAFYNTTQQVLGNKSKNFAYKGVRKTARTASYGSEPRRINLQGVDAEEMQLLHTIEEIRADQDLLQLILQMQMNPSFTSDKVMDELNRQGQLFAQRFVNLRIAATNSVIANGIIWLDADGNLLPTSAGAALTIDFGTPAGNRGTVGGLISTVWSNTGANIMQQVINICLYLSNLTGYKPKYAFYGKNIAQYLIQNTTLQNYFARNAVFRDKILETGLIPDGLFDLTWIPTWRMAYEQDANTTMTEQFDADGVTFFPEVNPQTWTMYEGSLLIPTTAQPFDGIEISMSKTKNVYGMGGYVVPNLKPLSYDQVYFDTFLPRLNIPNAVAYAHVT